MGAKEKTVGGGYATPTANNWNQFLNQQLTGMTPGEQNNQNYQQSLQQFAAANSGKRGFDPGPIYQQIQQLQSQQGGGMDNSQGMNVAPPNGAQSQFQNLFNGMASGNPNDPSGAFAQLQQMIARGGNTSPQFQNPYTSQQFTNPNINPLSTNLFAGQTGMADLSGVRGVQDTNFNVMQGFGGQPATTGYDSQLQQLISQMGGGGMGGVSAAATALDPARQVDLNDPLVKAMQEGVQRNKMIDIANTRARFGAEGAGALGTGAQVAEGTLAAEYAPREAAILQDAIRFQQQQDLAERQAKAGVGLQSNAQALQAGIASAGNQMQGSQAALSAALSGRGQDLQQMIANRGLDINQLGMGLNQAQGNQNAQLQMRGQDLSSILQNQGQGNQFNLAAVGQNQQNAQANNQNSLASAGMQNQFNLNNAGQQAQYGLGTNQLNASQGQFDQNQLMQMLQMGLGQNNFGQQNQNQLLQMLFGAFGQSNGIGTPQAQSVLQPSTGMQILQGGLQLGGQFLGGPGGQRLFGGSQQPATSSYPALPTFNWQQMAGQMPTTTWR